MFVSTGITNVAVLFNILRTFVPAVTNTKCRKGNKKSRNKRTKVRFCRVCPYSPQTEITSRVPAVVVVAPVEREGWRDRIWGIAAWTQFPTSKYLAVSSWLLTVQGGDFPHNPWLLSPGFCTRAMLYAKWEADQRRVEAEREEELIQHELEFGTFHEELYGPKVPELCQDGIDEDEDEVVTPQSTPVGSTLALPVDLAADAFSWADESDDDDKVVEWPAEWTATIATDDAIVKKTSPLPPVPAPTVLRWDEYDDDDDEVVWPAEWTTTTATNTLPEETAAIVPVASPKVFDWAAECADDDEVVEWPVEWSTATTGHKTTIEPTAPGAPSAPTVLDWSAEFDDDDDKDIHWPAEWLTTPVNKVLPESVTAVADQTLVPADSTASLHVKPPAELPVEVNVHAATALAVVTTSASHTANVPRPVLIPIPIPFTVAAARTKAVDWSASDDEAEWFQPTVAPPTAHTTIPLWCGSVCGLTSIQLLSPYMGTASVGGSSAYDSGLQTPAASVASDDLAERTKDWSEVDMVKDDEELSWPTSWYTSTRPV
jgi:hypothetical protein